MQPAPEPSKPTTAAETETVAWQEEPGLQPRPVPSYPVSLPLQRIASPKGYLGLLGYVLGVWAALAFGVLTGGTVTRQPLEQGAGWPDEGVPYLHLLCYVVAGRENNIIFENGRSDLLLRA